MHFKKTLSILLCSSALIAPFSALSNGKVSKIIIEGNKRVEASTIKNYLPIKVGDKTDVERQQESIQKLYKTHLFENVRIKYNDGVLKVKVEETPLVVKVVIKGNSKIGSKNINKVILTKSGQSLKAKELEHDLEKIIEMYKKSGRFSANVNYKVEKLKNNRVKIVFNVMEGPKTSVKRIRFVGNKHYRDDHLRSIILTKESKWFRFLSSDDTYDPDRMEYDQMLLSQFYKSVGYADFKIISANAELAPTKDHFKLYYAFDEGQKYKFGTKELSNNISAVKDKYIMRLLKVKKNAKYNANLIESIEQDVSDYLANKGYPAANVYHVLDKDANSRTINVRFIVDQSDKIYINKINISGNLKTHDNVIRREFDTQEGDLFNRSHIEKGDRNLRMLNYFEKVLVKPVATKNHGRYNIDIEVEEKSTTSIGLEGGYNSSIGPFASVNFQDRNLLGTGKSLDAGMRVAKKNTSYNFGITDPYFMGRDMSLGTSLFYTHVGADHASSFFGEGSNYTLDTKGGRLSLGYELFDDMRHNVFYTIKRDELKVSQRQESAFIREQVNSPLLQSVIL
jgi:outer membrane protein insertion porin family